MTASGDQLDKALEGDRKLARSIVAARTLIEAGLREQISRTTVSAADPRFQDYLRLVIGNATTERLHVTFVAQDWGYLADETIAQGTIAQVEGPLRRLLARAFDVGAHGIVLAHNHPSGCAEPSSADVQMTKKIERLARAVDIRLLDHLIVGGRSIVSMRERGLL